MKPPPTAASVLLLIVLLPLAMAAEATDGPPAVYLVFVDATPPGVPCMKYHLGILTAALGRYAPRIDRSTVRIYAEALLCMTVCFCVCNCRYIN